MALESLKKAAFDFGVRAGQTPDVSHHSGLGKEDVLCPEKGRRGRVGGTRGRIDLPRPTVPLHPRQRTPLLWDERDRRSERTGRSNRVAYLPRS